MDPITYFLAFARLAKVQCVSWGHPVTTGLTTIDYFVSHQLLEEEDPVAAQSHYSEKLILLSQPPTYLYPFQKYDQDQANFGEVLDTEQGGVKDITHDHGKNREKHQPQHAKAAGMGEQPHAGTDSLACLLKRFRHRSPLTERFSRPYMDPMALRMAFAGIPFFSRSVTWAARAFSSSLRPFATSAADSLMISCLPVPVTIFKPPASAFT